MARRVIGRGLKDEEAGAIVASLGACSVEEVIEDTGYGRGQLWANLLVNGSWLADGSEALMISALTKSLAAEWALAPTMQGALSAVVYAGALLGSLLSGWIGDAYGRRPAILLCFPAIIVFSLLSACSTGAAQLLALRFMVGLGFGVGQPNAVAILVEVSPVRWRTLNQGLAQVAFALGELFCCLLLWLDDPSLQHLRWRWMLAAGAIPAVIFWCLAWFSLRESPAHLALRDPKAAQEALEALRQMNGCGGTSFQVAAPGTGAVAQRGPSQLLRALERRYFWKTAALCLVCFSYNLTIYGAFFALPQLLPDLNVGMSAVAALAVGALIEIPFDFVGVVFGMLVSRKRALSLSFLGVAASLLLFLRSSSAGGAQSVALRLGYFGLKGFPQICSLVLYVFASESYPVAVRASGTALVLGIGRAGAALSPLVYEWSRVATSSHTAFFSFAALLTLASIFLVATLPETYHGSGKEELLAPAKLDAQGLGEEEPLVAAPPRNS